MPLRVAWATCVGAVLVTVLGPLALPGGVAKAVFPYTFGLIGLAALLLGMILVTDYHGSLSSVAKHSMIGVGSLLRVQQQSQKWSPDLGAKNKPRQIRGMAGLFELPIRIELMTFSLRVKRSTD